MADVGHVYRSTSLGGDAAHSQLRVEVIEATFGPSVAVAPQNLTAAGLVTNHYCLDDLAAQWLIESIAKARAMVADLKAKREAKP